jgi:ubiquitin-protein ligase
MLCWILVATALVSAMAHLVASSPLKMHGFSFAKFRLQKELSKLDPLPNTHLRELESPEERYVAFLEYKMHLDEGIYEGRTLLFHIKIPSAYPFAPPKLICESRIYTQTSTVQEMSVWRY